MTREPGQDGQEMEAQQPASRTSQQPWENVIGTSPEGLIISYRVAQQATHRPRIEGQESGRGSREPGLAAPRGAGWWRGQGDQQLSHFLLKGWPLSNSIWVLGFEGSAYINLSEKLEAFIILLF